MKYLKYLVVILVTMFICNINCMAASSKFDPTINLEPEIINEQITLILGYKGEEVMVVQHNLSWDERYLNLVDVIPLEAFNVTKNNPVSDGNYRTLTILGDSDYAFVDTNYAVIIFNLTDKFKVGTKTDLVWYNYQAAGKEVFKYRHKGYIMTLERETREKMVYLESMIDDSTKMDYWFKHNWILLVLGGLVIVAIIVIILVWPTKRRKEQREKKIREQVKDSNYNYGKNNYKIDNQKLDQIAGVNQEKDMSEAIVISDLNPFQSVEGTARTVAGQENVISQTTIESLDDAPAESTPPQVNAGVTLVENIPVNNNPNNLAQVYIPDQVLAPGQAPVAPVQPINVPVQTEPAVAPEVPEIPVQQTNEFDVGFDPFNMKLETEQLPVVEQNVQAPVPQVPVAQTPVEAAPIQNSGEDLIQEIKEEPVNNNDNLVLFQPQTFDSAHDTKIDTFIITLLFILSTLLFIPNNVKAFNYDTDELREYLVGNIPRDDSYDFNKDGSIDILDLIYTKDLNFVTMEEVGEDHPGFKDISLQGYTTTVRRGKNTTTTTRTTTEKTHPGFVDRDTTTTSITRYVSGEEEDPITIPTTTKQNTTRRTTSKGGTTRKTTTKSTTKGTTKKTTTTTKKSTTTSRTTTRKKTTTKKSTGTPKYTVTFKATNGTVAVSSVTVDRLEDIEVISTPNTGYTFDYISCTNNQDYVYNKSTNLIQLTGVTNNSSCSIRYKPNTYKITLEVNNTHKIETKTAQKKYGEKVSISVSSTYYDLDSVTCGNHTPSFSGGYFVIDKLQGNDTCSLKLKPKKYTITVNDNGKEFKINTNYMGSGNTGVYEFSSGNNLSSVKCGTTIISLTKSGSLYRFKYNPTKDITCNTVLK